MPTARSRARPRRRRSMRASARWRCISRSARCSAAARSTRPSRRSRTGPCSGSSDGSRTSCSSVSSRSSSPDGIPPHAAVSESVELARRTIGPRATGLTNAVLRRIAAEGPEWYAALPEGDPEEAALRHSLPDWIAEVWFEAYGEERGRALCAAANRPPPLSLWPNPLLDGAAVVDAWLAEAGAVAARDEATGVLRVDGPLDVAGSHAFASGAVVPIARAAVLIAQRVGAAAGHARARSLRGAGRQDRRARRERGRGDGRRRASRAREGALGDATAPRRRGRGRDRRRALLCRRPVRPHPRGCAVQRPGRPRRPPRRTLAPQGGGRRGARRAPGRAGDARPEPPRARRRAALRGLHAEPGGERGDRTRRGPRLPTTSCAPGRTRATTASTPRGSPDAVIGPPHGCAGRSRGTRASASSGTATRSPARSRGRP